MKKILIVDDDSQQRDILREILKPAGYDIRESDYGRDAIKKISAESFDVAVLDIVMPGMNGMDVLSECRRLSPATRVIMMSAFPSVDTAVNALKKGADDFISKPFNPSDLLSKVGALIEEASFEKRTGGLDLDLVLDALANPLRRKILKLLTPGVSVRLNELAKELKIQDHSKVLFHLKLLKESGIVEQDGREVLYSYSGGGKGHQMP